MICEHMATMRQKRAAKILAGNVGKSVGQAMREAGYSEVTADTPSKLTKSKSWKELMDEFLPKDKVARVHAELLDAEDIVIIKHKGKIIRERVPDNSTRKGAVDMSYKLRGEYAPDRFELTKRKYQEIPDDELAAKIEELTKKRKK